MWMWTQGRTEEYGQAGERRALEDLLARVAQGDREALAQLYSRTKGAVYGLALACLKHHHDAQDVTQDTYVRVWEAAPQYRPRGCPMGWLLTIARNLALTRLRQRGRQGELEPEEWEAVPAQEPGLSPEDRQLLRTALEVLGEEERQVVLLHAVSGLKHREIAALLDLPLATVLSKYHRALKKLRTKLEGDEDS